MYQYLANMSPLLLRSQSMNTLQSCQNEALQLAELPSRVCHIHSNCEVLFLLLQMATVFSAAFCGLLLFTENSKCVKGTHE